MKTEEEIRKELNRIVKETTDNIHYAAKQGGFFAGAASVILSTPVEVSGEVKALRWVLEEKVRL